MAGEAFGMGNRLKHALLKGCYLRHITMKDNHLRGHSNHALERTFSDTVALFSLTYAFRRATVFFLLLILHVVDREIEE